MKRQYILLANFAEDKEKALAVGMNAHIAKPMDMNTLIPLLLKYL